ncbi:hypothetical protein EV126DRAFT_125102 [Verticillium dahliae]|nr:hypothetical protein EV126DRAFT_125102 [Verticillium dahliae]
MLWSAATTYLVWPGSRCIRVYWMPRQVASCTTPDTGARESVTRTERETLAERYRRPPSSLAPLFLPRCHGRALRCGRAGSGRIWTLGLVVRDLSRKQRRCRRSHPARSVRGCLR